MHMKKINYAIALCLLLAAGFSSCEMKDEILGKHDGGANAGQLELELSSLYETPLISRADDGMTDNGEINGNFDRTELDVNSYTLIVTDADTQEEVKRGLISDLKNSKGKVVLALEAGTYEVTAYNYDGADVTVSERPYFEGKQTLTIQTGISTTTQVVCKLACIEVSVNPTTSFTNAFEDDYSVTVSNGEGANQTFTKENAGKKYYFKTPVQQNKLTVSIKATSKEGNFITNTYRVQKPEDAEGGSANLTNGDSFLINLTEDGATGSYLSIGITVDLTFTEDGETIEIPVENIIFSGQDEPAGPDDPAEQTISFTGLPVTYNCTYGDETIDGLQNVTIRTKHGIKNLEVTISGKIEGLLGMVDLPASFDICHLEDDLKGTLINLGLINEESYAQLNAGSYTDFTFDLSQLLVLVPKVTTGTSTFNLTVSDGVSTNGGDITVVVQPKE